MKYILIFIMMGEMTRESGGGVGISEEFNTYDACMSALADIKRDKDISREISQNQKLKDEWLNGVFYAKCHAKGK